MLDAVVPADSIADWADEDLAELVCSWTDGGPDAAWVHVAGELDLSTVPQLERTLREPQLRARLVVLDLRDLELIDTSGALAIVGASNRARQAGRRLVLLRAPPSIDRMLTLAARFGDLEVGDVGAVKPPVQTPVAEDLVR